MRFITRMTLGVALFALTFVLGVSAHAGDEKSSAPMNHAECTGIANAMPVVSPAQNPETTPGGAVDAVAAPHSVLRLRGEPVISAGSPPVASLPFYLLSSRLRL